MKQYKATKRGFDGVKTREAGEVFSADFGKSKPSWCEAYTPPKKESKK